MTETFHSAIFGLHKIAIMTLPKQILGYHLIKYSHILVHYDILSAFIMIAYNDDVGLALMSTIF